MDRQKRTLRLSSIVLIVGVVVLGVVVAIRDSSAQAQTSVCVTGGAVPAGNAALVGDCETLLGMKTALRGSVRLNWWSGKAIAQWDGISVGSGRVVGLSLPNRGLDGIIPAGTGDLSALTTLDLSSNSLTGNIPSSLGNLSNLTRWRLAGNSLTGCVPQQLSLVTDNDLATLGLPVCGSGTPTPPTPTPVTSPTPTATPTLMPPTSDDVVKRIHCQSADFVAAFGETYNIDDDRTAFYYYDRNGRGVWEILSTVWTSSSDSSRVVACRTTVFDNIFSAVVDNQYAMLVEQASGYRDVLRQHKRCCEDIGQVYRGLLLQLGYTAVVGTNEIVWQETATRLAAVSSFRWNQVIVQVAVYDDSAFYLDHADDMARRVEDRFDDSIFDEIETRQRAAQSERGVAGSPLSEDSLYLEPPISKP